MKMLKDGAIYRYHDKTGRYLGMQIHKGVATIILETEDTQEIIKKDFYKINEWLPEFELLSLPEKHQEEPSLPVQVSQDNSLIRELRDSILGDMKKVGEDKAYIPQAKQRCNLTNTLLDLVKIELQLRRGK
jgi:hypothetical protein